LTHGTGGPPEALEGLCHIAHEALTRVLRYTRATLPITGIRTFGNSVELVVEESSRGFDTGAGRDWSGVGLTSMRKRSEELGGSLMVLSASGEGSRVQVEVSH